MQQNESENNYLQKYACMDWQIVIKAFHASPLGYTDSDVCSSRKKYGCNDSENKMKESIAYCLRRAFINPFSIILFILGIITLLTDGFLSSQYQKDFINVIILFLMIIISGIVRFEQELKAKKVSDDLTKLVQSFVFVLRDERWIELPASEVVVGDQVRLGAGDRVPADLRLMDTEELFVSQSVITGESQICRKTPETLEEKPNSISGYSNILFCGTTIIGGNATGIVLAVGDDTVYGSLNLKKNRDNRSFDRGANSIARVLIRFMAILVPIVFIASGLTKGDWLEAFLFALSVAVGLTPELLPMVVNACLAKGSYFMGKKQTIVKNINAMQGFGSMDVLCVDKTGTLTRDTVILEYYIDILGNESQKTLDYGYLESYFNTGVGNHLDSAIRKVEQMPGKEQYYKQLTLAYHKLDEQPFDYNNRFSNVLLEKESEELLIIKGGIGEVVSKCRYAEYAGEIVEIGEDGFTSVHAIVDEMLEDGMKVIAIAYKNLNEKDSLTAECNEYVLLGYLAFFDAPKKSATSAIAKLHKLNVNIKVLTGDQRLVAESICQRIGIQSENILTGSDIDNLSPDELPFAIERTNIFAELSPKQKAHVVEVLQMNGHSVGFLGDGMNDLPAVLQADVGISVENAAEALKESADVILLKKDLNVLEEGVLEGRKAFCNMSKYIKITASSNFGNICAIVVASILLPFFPMTSVQLLLLNLLYDILCLILPWDLVDEEMLARPLDWSGKKLGGFMMFFGPLSSIFDLITFAVLYFIICPLVCGGGFFELELSGQTMFISLFQTGWFLESMWTQILILQLLRTEKLPFIQSKTGKLVIMVTILGIVLYTLLPVTVFGKMLGLCPMPAEYFVFLVADVLLYLFLVTIAKTMYFKRNKKLI
ncbi:MAG: magnesium-translocating P-type ATPase [Clostridiales bacterium]|nr:magnesium-translocating P-type ATPase [Clostridiales bacterium]